MVGQVLLHDQALVVIEGNSITGFNGTKLELEQFKQRIRKNGR